MTHWWLLGFIAVLLLSACDVNPAERTDAGNGLYRQGDYAAALDAYQLAQVAAPDLPQPYFNAASAYVQSGRLEKAIAALNQALRTADDGLAADAYYNLGNIYFQMSRYDDAVNAYRQTLLRRPDDQDARYNLELALSRIAVATPTPPPNGQSVTPSPGEMATENSPESTGAATPTATQLVAEPTVGAAETNPPSSGSGSLSRQEAESRLDAIQGDQQTLHQQLLSQATGLTPSGKDW